MISVYEQVIPVIQSMSLRAAVNAPFKMIFLLMALYDVIERGSP